MSEQKRRADFSLAPWKRLLPFYRRYRGLIAIVLVSNVLIAAGDFLLPLLQAEAVDAFIMTGTLAGLGAYVARYLAVVAMELAALVVNFLGAMRLEMCAGRDMKEEQG